MPNVAMNGLQAVYRKSRIKYSIYINSSKSTVCATEDQLMRLSLTGNYQEFLHKKSLGNYTPVSTE